MTADDQRLSAYYDGELPPAEMEQMRLRLESEPELQQKLDGLNHLTQLLQMESEDAGSEDADLDSSEALLAGIMGKLAAEPSGAKVIDFPGTPAPAEGVEHVAEVIPLPIERESAGRPPSRRRWLWSAAAGLVAAAAAIGFFVLRPEPGPADEAVELANPDDIPKFAIDVNRGERYAEEWVEGISGLSFEETRDLPKRQLVARLVRARKKVEALNRLGEDAFEI